MEKKCSTCGGTGQIGFFQGVSRFLLTWEECPQCAGTGFADQEKEQADPLQQKRGKGANGPGQEKE